MAATFGAVAINAISIETGKLLCETNFVSGTNQQQMLV